MWIPDYVEQHSEKAAEVKKAEVMIRVAQSSLRAAEAKVRTTKARITSAQAGVKRAEASYTRWESEYKRLETLVTQRVLDVQVRDETFRQFQEAAAARDQAEAMVSETVSAHDQAVADRDRAEVDVESARAQLQVAQATERESRVLVEYGKIKAPYDGVITQRNVSPGDYLQPGAGSAGRPLFVLEQTDPVRVFVGVPELASFFIHPGDTATIRMQAIPGAIREGKVVRTSFSLDPSHPHASDRDRRSQLGRPPPPRLVCDRERRDRAQAGLDPSLQCHRNGGAAKVLRLPGGRRQARPHSGDHRPVRRHAHRGAQEILGCRQHERLAAVRRHRAGVDGQPRNPLGRQDHSRAGCGRQEEQPSEM